MQLVCAAVQWRFGIIIVLIQVAGCVAVAGESVGANQSKPTVRQITFAPGMPTDPKTRF